MGDDPKQPDPKKSAGQTMFKGVVCTIFSIPIGLLVGECSRKGHLGDGMFGNDEWARLIISMVIFAFGICLILWGLGQQKEWW
jgi:hypothetical protein